MRDTIAWSHDLLSPEEQTVFRRLAVFPGGCTIEAAEAVAGAESALDVFAGMAALVDESLLRQEEGAEGEPRFRMLETVREYGLEQLEASGEGDDHARPPRGLVPDPGRAGRARSPLAAPCRREWVARLEEELPNLRAAVTWLLARGEATRALRLLVAAEDFWTQRHLSDAELHRWLEAALAAAPDAPARDRVLAHWLLSTGNGLLGDDEAALHHAQRLLDGGGGIGRPGRPRVRALRVGARLGRPWRSCPGGGRLCRGHPAVADGGRLMVAMPWIAQAELADKLILQGDLEAGVPMLEEALRACGSCPIPPGSWCSSSTCAATPRCCRTTSRWRRACLRRPSRRAGACTHAVAPRRHSRAGGGGAGTRSGGAGGAVTRRGRGRASNPSGCNAGTTGSMPNASRRTTRAALPTAAFEQAWAAGRAVPLEEAITEALTIADEVAIHMDG